jgi:hypothetical protein
VSVLALSAGPALAAVTESGTRTCPADQTGKTHAKFNDEGLLFGPGSTSGTWWRYFDGLWHIKEAWGVDGGGYWQATGDPQLNLTDTYAYCTP